jgi:hypothetical protein
MTEREREEQLYVRAAKIAEALSEIPYSDSQCILNIASAILERREMKKEEDDRDRGEHWREPEPA